MKSSEMLQVVANVLTDRLIEGKKQELIREHQIMPVAYLVSTKTDSLVVPFQAIELEGFHRFFMLQNGKDLIKSYFQEMWNDVSVRMAVDFKWLALVILSDAFVTEYNKSDIKNIDCLPRPSTDAIRKDCIMTAISFYGHAYTSFQTYEKIMGGIHFDEGEKGKQFGINSIGRIASVFPDVSASDLGKVVIAEDLAEIDAQMKNIQSFANAAT